MTTISRLYKNKETRGEIAVNKSYMVPLDKLYIENGFNIREIDLSHVESICESYCAGDYIPPIVVEPGENGMMKIVDGHHRYNAAMMAVGRGVEIKRLQCESFTGDKAEQWAFMIKSSQSRNLNPVERGGAYKRFESHGFTRDEIAAKVGRSRGDVDHHIAIAEMPEQVKEQVKSGEISASLALELYNKSGSEAVAVAVDKAKSEGSKRATKKHTSLWKPRIGKESVTRLMSAQVVEESDSDVTLKVSTADWQYIQDAIEMIEGDSNEKL